MASSRRWRLEIAGKSSTTQSSAGSLYDSIDGRQCWALIKDGQISSRTYHDGKPEAAVGERWLPVVHIDSEPFNFFKHWRLKPVCTIEQDKVVVCKYPVVATWEHA
jgi:hypothetical protein